MLLRKKGRPDEKDVFFWGGLGTDGVLNDRSICGSTGHTHPHGQTHPHTGVMAEPNLQVWRRGSYLPGR